MKIKKKTVIKIKLVQGSPQNKKYSSHEMLFPHSYSDKLHSRFMSRVSRVGEGLRKLRSSPTHETRGSSYKSENNLKFYEKKLDQKIFFNSIGCIPCALFNTNFSVHPIFLGAPLSKRIVIGMFFNKTINSIMKPNHFMNRGFRNVCQFVGARPTKQDRELSDRASLAKRFMLLRLLFTRHKTIIKTQKQISLNSKKLKDTRNKSVPLTEKYFNVWNSLNIFTYSSSTEKSVSYFETRPSRLAREFVYRASPEQVHNRKNLEIFSIVKKHLKTI